MSENSNFVKVGGFVSHMGLTLSSDVLSRRGVRSRSFRKGQSSNMWRWRRSGYVKQTKSIRQAEMDVVQAQLESSASRDY